MQWAEEAILCLVSITLAAPVASNIETGTGGNYKYRSNNDANWSVSSSSIRCARVGLVWVGEAVKGACSSLSLRFIRATHSSKEDLFKMFNDEAPKSHWTISSRGYSRGCLLYKKSWYAFLC